MAVHNLSLSTASPFVLNRGSQAVAQGAPAAAVIEDMQLVTHLLSSGQTLCGHMSGEIDALCREVSSATNGRAQLCLGRQRTPKKGKFPPTTLLTLPLQFGNVVYGTLCVTFDPLHPEQPSISLPIVHLLVQVCSWLLYTIEQAAFLQGQCQQLDYQIHGPLTEREREGLTLMCQRHNQQAIADLLCISPATVGKHRQHIYEQLGVHCEHDALLVAYQTGLFSLIDDNVS